MQSFTVVLSPDPNAGGYSVSVPGVLGAISEGDTRDEALSNIREAIGGILELMRAQGIEPESETPQIVAAEVEKILGYRAEEGWPLIVETAIVQLDLAAVA